MRKAFHVRVEEGLGSTALRNFPFSRPDAGGGHRRLVDYIVSSTTEHQSLDFLQRVCSEFLIHAC